MTPVEKNDVDISRLFFWNKKITVKLDSGKEMTVYVRLIGDADTNRAKVMALRESAKLRAALKTQESDERLAYVPFYEDIDTDKLIESILIYSMREFTQQAVRELNITSPKEPSSDASTERIEKYQKEVDEYPQKREKALRDSIEARVNKYRLELEGKDRKYLENIYEKSLVNEICEQELLSKYKEFCTFFGLYKDKKFTERLFDDFATFNNLPTDTKNSLMAEYSFLEIEAEELKK